MSAWPAIESDLRRAMLQAGRSEREIDATLDALRPVVLAVERAGTRIDIELCWALLCVLADKQRRAAVHARLRRAS